MTRDLTNVVGRINQMLDCYGDSNSGLSWHDADLLTDVADLLELLMDQMQITSAIMSGQHHWRLRTSGWPMQHLRGPNHEAALTNLLNEYRKERS